MRHHHSLPSRLRAAALVAAPLALLSIASPAMAQAPEHAQEQVVAPVVASHVDAVYPPSALAERKHGDVVLALTVDADGHVSGVDVMQSGGSDLDEAAVVAAR